MVHRKIIMWPQTTAVVRQRGRPKTDIVANSLVNQVKCQGTGYENRTTKSQPRKRKHEDDITKKNLK